MWEPGGFQGWSILQLQGRLCISPTQWTAANHTSTTVAHTPLVQQTHTPLIPPWTPAWSPEVCRKIELFLFCGRPLLAIVINWIWEFMHSYASVCLGAHVYFYLCALTCTMYLSPPVRRRVPGLRISLSNMLRIWLKEGLSPRSLSQQSSMSWWSTTGQSMGAGSLYPSSIALITFIKGQGLKMIFELLRLSDNFF